MSAMVPPAGCAGRVPGCNTWALETTVKEANSAHTSTSQAARVRTNSKSPTAAPARAARRQAPDSPSITVRAAARHPDRMIRLADQAGDPAKEAEMRQIIPGCKHEQTDQQGEAGAGPVLLRTWR